MMHLLDSFNDATVETRGSTELLLHSEEGSTKHVHSLSQVQPITDELNDCSF